MIYHTDGATKSHQHQYDIPKKEEWYYGTFNRHYAYEEHVTEKRRSKHRTY